MQSMHPASAVFSDKFTEALLYAVGLHGAQRRKTSLGASDGPSYLGHLLGVAALVIEDGGTEAEVIGALLHDTIEDTDNTGAELGRRFGPEVAAIVVGCTDSHGEPKPPWRERKQGYLEHLSESSPSVLRVSNADKLYNARTILSDLRNTGNDLWDRFSGGKDGVLWYYSALSSTFATVNPGTLADELQRTVTEIVGLAE